MLENDIQVRTPEQVRLKLHLAGIGSRTVAQLIDLVILAVVYTLFTVSEVMWQWVDVFGRATSYLVGAIAVISFLIFWGYFIALETALSGQTVGKRIMKIRSVQRDGRPITFYSATIRNLLRIIDFLPFGYFIGLVVTLIDKQERRIGDLAAGTVVVHDRMPRLWQHSGYELQGVESGDETSAEPGPGPQIQVISVAKCPVSVEITPSLPGEWSQFLIDLGPRLKGLSKSRREELLPELWRNFISLNEVSLRTEETSSVDLTLTETERLLMAVSRQVRGPRRGRKSR